MSSHPHYVSLFNTRVYCCHSIYSIIYALILLSNVSSTTKTIFPPIAAEITEHINEYARVKLAMMQLCPRSIWQKWCDITVDEMKAYTAVILNMAMNDKPGM